MDLLFKLVLFVAGIFLVARTLLSAISSFVLPRPARSRLNRFVFGLVWRVFELIMHSFPDYDRRDALMAYYSPIGLMLLVPTWYVLVSIGYAMMYVALGIEPWQRAFVLSGSSLLTLGVFSSEVFLVDLLMFSEAVLGLILVALLISYLPTMYSAFSRREEAVNLLEVRAGSPPSAVEMLQRYHRIHGLDRLADYWFTWETWFADVEESHTVLPALVFFRSPRPQNAWVVAAGTVLDTAALTLSAVEIPYAASAALTIRAGFLCLRRICESFDIRYPRDPHFPQDPISITRAEFDLALEKLEASGVPLKADREQAWNDFAGWRVNYDQPLLALCALTLAPSAPWTSDRAVKAQKPPLFILKKKPR